MPAPKKISRKRGPTQKEIAKKIRSLLKGGNKFSVESMASYLHLDVEQVENGMKEIRRSSRVDDTGGLISIDKPGFGRLDLAAVKGEKWHRFGLVSDTHLGSRQERLAELHAAYDLFEEEGITHVLHAGNIIDGYLPRINKESCFAVTVDDQSAYCVDHYPQRDGITTHFITGDDHEGWWIKDGINVGWIIQRMAEDAGRTDLQYIGHVEADVVVLGEQGQETIIKVSHPGGGSAYARSYKAQKAVESYEGGEKPHILMQGHYHVYNQMRDRNVYVIGMPGFQDQTMFARKLNLRFDVGCVIMEFQQDSEGLPVRFRTELTPFLTRGFYKSYLRSDTRLIKGRMVVEGGKAKRAPITSNRRKSR